MGDDYYRKMVDGILEDIIELVPIPGDPEDSLANCEDGLRDLLEIRETVNFHIRQTRKELKRRKDEGNPEIDEGLMCLVDVIEQRRQA